MCYLFEKVVIEEVRRADGVFPAAATTVASGGSHGISLSAYPFRPEWHDETDRFWLPPWFSSSEHLQPPMSRSPASAHQMVDGNIGRPGPPERVSSSGDKDDSWAEFLAQTRRPAAGLRATLTRRFRRQLVKHEGHGAHTGTFSCAGSGTRDVVSVGFGSNFVVAPHDDTRNSTEDRRVVVELGSEASDREAMVRQGGESESRTDTGGCAAFDEPTTSKAQPRPSTAPSLGPPPAESELANAAQPARQRASIDARGGSGEPPVQDCNRPKSRAGDTASCVAPISRELLFADITGGDAVVSLKERLDSNRGAAGRAPKMFSASVVAVSYLTFHQCF